MKRAFLTGLGITDTDVIKQIIDYHQGVVTDMKEDITTVKGELKTAQDALKKQPEQQDSIKVEDTEEYKALKAKYDTDTARIQSDFDTYKTAKETEAVKSAKLKALHKHLKADNVVEGSEELLESKFDLEKLELDGDNIKGWDKNEQAVAVKGKFAKFFGTTETVTHTPATPPVGQGGASEPKSLREAIEMKVTGKQ